jgi:transcriptional regulator with XRE-family HTH domain
MPKRSSKREGTAHDFTAQKRADKKLSLTRPNDDCFGMTMTLIAKLLERFKSSFEYRHTYMESFADSYTATQIKVLRERLKLSQRALAERAGMQQSQISTLEDVNNSTWKVSTLRKIARAFDMVLVVRFEEFGATLPDIDRFGRDSLNRRPFSEDPIFAESSTMQKGSASATPQQVMGAAVANNVVMFKPRTERTLAFSAASTTSTTFVGHEATAR